MNLNRNDEHTIPHPIHLEDPSVNPKTGRVEAPFANLRLIYPRADAEYSFEELRAQHRGLLNVDWDATRRLEQEQANTATLAVEETPILQDISPGRQEQEEVKERIFVHVDAEAAGDPVPSPLAEDEERPSEKTQIHADTEPAPLLEEDQIIKASIKLLIHVDNEEPAPLLDEHSNKASAELLIHVGDEELASLPEEDQANKASTKLIIHVDEEEPSQPASPTQKVQKKANKAFAVLADDEPKPQISPMAEQEHKREALRTQTVALKGIDDEPNFNDENTPPSQLEIEKAKATKKARREERSNRTRKIKVMEVKEIRSETQTSE